MLKSCFNKGVCEAGVDEAGRGPLAGPVVAAAVILPEGFRHKTLDDSKKLPKAVHKNLALEIKEQATSWHIAIASPKEIDEINILQATFLAMHRAIKGLKTPPEHLIIDGNRFKPYPFIAHQCIIKGDGKYLSIAAASILAKNYRDELMLGYHEQFPGYGWETNAGYPTKKHKEAIKKLGLTPIHRKSFKYD